MPSAPSPRASFVDAQPLAFEPNAGRFGGGYDYLVRGDRSTLGLSARRSTLALGRGRVLRTRLRGVKASSSARPGRRLGGVVNWYAGPRRSWRAHLPTYGGVTYDDVYRGIDLSYHGRDGRLEYDFRLAPHARVSAIELELSGADALRIARNGDLVARLGARTVRQLRPVAFQGKRHVAARFVLDGRRVGFRVGSYDHAQPLVIDPVLAYSDYLGGSAPDTALDDAVDSQGNVYVAGYTSSPSLPGTSQSAPAGPAGYVVKVHPDGSREWASYYAEWISGVAVGPGDKVWIAGKGTLGAGGIDAFAGELNGDGSKAWTTRFGGSGSDYGGAIAVDQSGASYLTGYTYSSGLATVGQTTLSGPSDAFVAKFDPSGTKLFSTYLGGSSNDEGTGIGVDPRCASNCAVYVGGDTYSSDFPTTTGANDRTFDVQWYGSGIDAFVTKVSETGASRPWSSFAGGPGTENAGQLAVGPTGFVSLVGHTTPYSGSTQLPSQAFVRTFFPNSADLADPSLDFGGSGNDEAYDASYDAQGNFYMAGMTASADIYLAGQVQANRLGPDDAFVAKWKLTTNSIGNPVISSVYPQWSTYLGGAGHDSAYGVATNTNGGTWVVGSTGSNDFPVAGATQTASDTSNAFITRLQIAPAKIDSGPEGVVATGNSVTFTYSSAEAGGGYRCRLSPAERDFSTCPNGGKTYDNLGDGPYDFSVEAVDQAGTPGEPATRHFEIDTKPHANLTIAPNPVLAGRSVTFDGSSSTAGPSTIAKYEWDLNGDGSFERDTGTTSKTGEAFKTAGVVPISLRVTTAAGLTSVVTQNLTVTAASGPAQFGITINNGAQYTRTPNVTVTSNFPAATTDLLLSNDGGFLAPQDFPAAKTIKWKLDSSGPERLPKIVYVRFLNGDFVSETHIDDIILDETPPKVDSAAVTPAAGSARVTASAARKHLRKWTLKVKARDSNSGVAKLQATANKRKPGKAVKYRRKLTVKAATRPRWIRARDRAGNWSRWKRAR